MIPAVGLILALCGFAVSVAVSVLIVWRYTDRRDKDLIPIVITTVSLSLVFFCVVLIPIDVYSLGSSQNSQSASLTYSFSSISSSSEAGEVLSTSFMPGVIKCLYYVFFGLLSLCVFVAIPFGYFYFEESEDDDITPKERVVTACKYTVFTVLTVVILLVIGAFVHTGSSGSDKQSATSAWYTYVRESSGVFARGVGFVASIIGLLGLAVWLVYTAYGLSGLPVGLMRGKKHVADELNETQRDLEKTRQRLRDLRDKHAGGAKMSLKDTQEFNILKQQEKIYARHADLLMGEKESRLTRCLAYLKPFSIVLGAVLVIVSVFLLISIAISLIGKALNSTCGHSCGFMFSIPKFFPVDVILYAVVVVYLFVCTLSGIRKLGVRILWIELFPVRSKATSPQGLLLMAAYLIMSFIALTFEMTTIAPRYAVFGSQRYVAADGVEKYCSFDAPVSECRMTQISKFVGSVIGVNQSFVGVIIYYASYVFIVVSVVDAVLSFIRKKSDRIEIGSDSFDEDDDIEIDYRKPSRDYDSDPLDEPDGVILQK